MRMGRQWPSQGLSSETWDAAFHLLLETESFRGLSALSIWPTLGLQVYHHTCLFTWVPAIQTPVFMLSRQALN